MVDNGELKARFLVFEQEQGAADGKKRRPVALSYLSAVAICRSDRVTEAPLVDAAASLGATTVATGAAAAAGASPPPVSGGDVATDVLTGCPATLEFDNDNGVFTARCRLPQSGAYQLRITLHGSPAVLEPDAEDDVDAQRRADDRVAGDRARLQRMSDTAEANVAAAAEAVHSADEPRDWLTPPSDRDRAALDPRSLEFALLPSWSPSDGTNPIRDSAPFSAGEGGFNMESTRCDLRALAGVMRRARAMEHLRACQAIAEQARSAMEQAERGEADRYKPRRTRSARNQLVAIDDSPAPHKRLRGQQDWVQGGDGTFRNLVTGAQAKLHYEPRASLSFPWRRVTVDELAPRYRGGIRGDGGQQETQTHRGDGAVLASQEQREEKRQTLVAEYERKRNDDLDNGLEPRPMPVALRREVDVSAENPAGTELAVEDRDVDGGCCPALRPIFTRKVRTGHQSTVIAMLPLVERNRYCSTLTLASL